MMSLYLNDKKSIGYIDVYYNDSENLSTLLVEMTKKSYFENIETSKQDEE
mgnify:CR=1 FL=1